MSDATPKPAAPDRLLILSVFVVASCGLAYELIAGALSSYLLGDSVLQFSSIIGCYLFAMGVGSHLSKYVDDRDVLARFIDIELLVGLIGGVSATVLFLLFAWMSAPFRTVLYALVFALGVLVGMEIPLVMRVLHNKQARFSELVSRVLTFDYLGALAVSLLFPLVLAPKLGLSRTGFLFGMVNAAVALWTLRHYAADIPNIRARLTRGILVMSFLAGGLVMSEQLTRWAERGLYGDEVIFATTTPYQRLVLTRWKDDTRLHINGNLQFSSRDEHRYHEALVHPALQAMPWARSVLVLGGGDGLAVPGYPQAWHGHLAGRHWGPSFCCARPRLHRRRHCGKLRGPQKARAPWSRKPPHPAPRPDPPVRRTQNPAPCRQAGLADLDHPPHPQSGATGHEKHQRGS